MPRNHRNYFITIIGCEGEAHIFKNIKTERPYIIREAREGFSEQVMSELKSEE